MILSSVNFIPEDPFHIVLKHSSNEQLRTNEGNSIDGTTNGGGCDKENGVGINTDSIRELYLRKGAVKKYLYELKIGTDPSRVNFSNNTNVSNIYKIIYLCV